MAPSLYASLGRSLKVSTSFSENRDCWPCSIGLLRANVVSGTTATDLFGTTTNYISLAVDSVVALSLLRRSIWWRFVAGPFGVARSSPLLFVWSFVAQEVSRAGLQISVCLAGLGLGVVHGEVTLGTGVLGLAWPQIVMLSIFSVVVSACVGVGVGVGVSSFHSSCNNYKVHCCLA